MQQTAPISWSLPRDQVGVGLQQDSGERGVVVKWVKTGQKRACLFLKHREVFQKLPSTSLSAAEQREGRQQREEHYRQDPRIRSLSSGVLAPGVLPRKCPVK